MLPLLGPTAFPDIKPPSPKQVREFIAKRVPQVLESDPPLRKLQKAKLQAAVAELELLAWNRTNGDTRVPDQVNASAYAQAIQTAVATGVELADRPEDRRAWLEFGVGLEKEHEALFVSRVNRGIAPRSLALTVRRSRFDAEIALQKHIEQSGGKAK
jgi:hypothetical protein